MATESALHLKMGTEGNAAPSDGAEQASLAIAQAFRRHPHLPLRFWDGPLPTPEAAARPIGEEAPNIGHADGTPSSGIRLAAAEVGISSAEEPGLRTSKEAQQQNASLNSQVPWVTGNVSASLECGIGAGAGQPPWAASPLDLTVANGQQEWAPFDLPISPLFPALFDEDAFGGGARFELELRPTAEAAAEALATTAQTTSVKPGSDAVAARSLSGHEGPGATAKEQRGKRAREEKPNNLLSMLRQAVANTPSRANVTCEELRASSALQELQPTTREHFKAEQAGCLPVRASRRCRSGAWHEPLALPEVLETCQQLATLGLVLWRRGRFATTIETLEKGAAAAESVTVGLTKPLERIHCPGPSNMIVFDSHVSEAQAKALETMRRTGLACSVPVRVQDPSKIVGRTQEMQLPGMNSRTFQWPSPRGGMPAAGVAIAGQGRDSVLKQRLYMAAEGVDQGDLQRFHDILGNLKGFAKPWGTAAERMVYVLLKSLILRVNGEGCAFVNSVPRNITLQERLQAKMYTYMSTPYAALCSATALHALFPHLRGKRSIHLVHFGEGFVQCVGALMKALSKSHVKDSEPVARLERVHMSFLELLPMRLPGRSDLLSDRGVVAMGQALLQEAEALGIQFTYDLLAVRKEDLQALKLVQRQDVEMVVAFNFADFRTFSDDPRLFNGLGFCVTELLRRLKTDLILFADECIDCCSSPFLERFRLRMEIEWAWKESADACIGDSRDGKRLVRLEEKVSKDLDTISIVACEGEDRAVILRSPALWEKWFQQFGFQLVPQSSDSSSLSGSILERFPKDFSAYFCGNWGEMSWKGTCVGNTSLWRSV